MTVGVSVVIPAYNEGEAIVPVLDRIFDAVRVRRARSLVVVDFAEDTTVPVARGVLGNASRGCAPWSTPTAGVRRTPSGTASTTRADPVVVVTMADGCDDPRQIDDLARLVDRGVVVAAASRYMRRRPAGRRPAAEGRAVPGRRAVARASSARVGTRDATNSFKAYSTDFVREVGIDSRSGFEIGLELTAKARRLRRPVAEVPTIWLDRTVGESNFELATVDSASTCAGTASPSARSCPLERGPARRGARSRALNNKPPQRTQEGARHVSADDSRRSWSPGPPGSSAATSSRSCCARGYEVVGVDNYSKYGPVEKSYDDHPDYHFVEDDARDVDADDQAARRTATTSSPAPR